MRMEAAGIEPASRSISAGASTCVFGEFDSLKLAADPPTGHPVAEPGFFSPACRQATG